MPRSIMEGLDPEIKPFERFDAPPEISSDIFGSESGYLSQALKGLFRGESPAISSARKAGRRSIGRATEKGITGIKEAMASGGFRGGGANLFTELFGEQQDAFANLEAGLAGTQAQISSDALRNLLSLNMFQGGQALSKEQLLENRRQFERALRERARQFDRSLAFQQEQAGFDLGDLFGGIGSTLIGGATGGISAGIGNLFEGLFS